LEIPNKFRRGPIIPLFDKIVFIYKYIYTHSRHDKQEINMGSLPCGGEQEATVENSFHEKYLNINFCLITFVCVAHFSSFLSSSSSFVSFFHSRLVTVLSETEPAGECIVLSSSSSSSSSGRPSGNSGVVSSGGGNNSSSANNSTAVYGRLVPEEQLAALGRGLSVINPNAAINSSSLGK
jgi:hypothetical protein